MNTRWRSWILLLGDLGLMYAALALALYVRGGEDFLQAQWSAHMVPFSVLNVAWIVIFYISDLYARRHIRVGTAFFQRFATASLVNATVAIAYFYLVPFLHVSPKTNLALYLVCFGVLILLWRSIAGRLLTGSAITTPIAFFASNVAFKSMRDELLSSPGSMYRVVNVFSSADRALLDETVNARSFEILVVGNAAYVTERERLYRWMLTGVTITDEASFWEEYTQKTPFAQADEVWFIQALRTKHSRLGDFVKRAFDLLASMILGTILFVPSLAIALLIRLTSPGPALYQQTRVGKHGRPFIMFKFRTMRIDAEKDGAKWSTKNDPRVTRIGRVLRHTHLDEAPQLWNILRGDMSFIGPRPERPGFVSTLKEQIPFYDLRHLVKPGITGWAQVNYRYGATVDDAARKLAYDLYYVKHRTWVLDIKISLKTLTTVFRGEGR